MVSSCESNMEPPKKTTSASSSHRNLQGYTLLESGKSIYEERAKGKEGWTLVQNKGLVEKIIIYLGCHTIHNEKGAGIFTLIGKTLEGNLVVLKTPQMYRVYVAADSRADIEVLRDKLRQKMPSKHAYHFVDTGVKRALFKGTKIGAKICTYNYEAYNSLCSNVRYLINKDIDVRCTLCNDSIEPEDQMLWHLNLFAADYIKIVIEDGVPMGVAKFESREESSIDYKPRIASFDNEMLTVDSLDPKFGLYMNSYYCDGVCYVFYTKDFYQHPLTLPREEDTPYEIICILCQDNVDLVNKFFYTIYHTRPDILTGYFTYYADNPIILAPLARRLMLPPRDPYTGIVPYVEYTKKLEKRSEDAERGLSFVIPGVTTVDMYTYLDANLPNEKKNDMTLDNMARTELGDAKIGLSYAQQLENYYSDDVSKKIDTIKYAAHDAYLPAKLLEKFEVWKRTRATYKLTGMHPSRQLIVGMVMQVYGCMCIEASKRNMVIDTPVSRGARPGGGHVEEPSPGIHYDVYCLDVISMYPHIGIQYEICPSNSYSPKYIEDEYERAIHDKVDKGMSLQEWKEANYHILEDRNLHEYYFKKGAKPLFSEMLDMLIQRRNGIKRKIASLDKSQVNYEYNKALLEAEEAATKLIANSAVGALGETASGTNPIMCSELNDVVTHTGQVIWGQIKTLASELDYTIVYGDTDSVFVKGPGDVKELVKYINDNLPDRIKIKEEYKADSMIISKKKHYICDVQGKIKIAGYKSVKSSAPEICRDVFSRMIEVLLREGSEAMVEAYHKNLADYQMCTNIDRVCWKVKNSGKTLSSTSAKAQLLERLAKRGVTFTTGEIKYMVYVYTFERYVEVYQAYPPIKLPHERELKTKPDRDGVSTELEYCIEEVQAHLSVVNVPAIINKFCLSNLMDVLGVITRQQVLSEQMNL